MSFPAGLTLVTVHGRLDTLPNGGASGTVRFTNSAALLGATDNSIVPYVDETVSLDSDGEFTIALPATNDPGWAPVDAPLTVVINAGVRTIRGTILLDYQTTSVEFSDLFQPDGAAEAGVTYATLAQLNTVSADVDTAQADITTAQSDITTLQGDVSTLTTDLATAQTDITAALRAMWRPTDQGLVGWAFDPREIQGGFQLADEGLAYVIRVRVLTSVITNIEVEIVAAGSSLTDCFALITNDAGAQIGSGAITADQSTAWQSTGRKRMALTNGGSGVTPGDWHRIVLWANGSSLPEFGRAANISADALNSGMTAPTLRWSTANTGMTTVSPAGSFNLASQTASGVALWAALS